MSLLQSQVEIDHMLTKTAYSEGYKKGYEEGAAVEMQKIAFHSIRMSLEEGGLKFDQIHQIISDISMEDLKMMKEELEQKAEQSKRM